MSKTWTDIFAKGDACNECQRHLSLNSAWMLQSRSCFELILRMNKLKTIDREAVSWKFLLQIQKVRKTLSRSWIRSRKWNRLSTWQNSTQNPSQIRAHFVIFLKTSMKHLKIHKFPFKNVIVLAIECKMYLKNFTALVAFQNRPCAPSWRKQGWIPRRTISWWKASLTPQKENWPFFWTFSFYFLSFNGVFLSLKCRTLILKHLHGDRAAAIVLKMMKMEYLSLRFPNMVKVKIHEHWTRGARFNPLWVSGTSYSKSLF